MLADLKIMAQQVEDAKWTPMPASGPAPTEGTAQRTGSPNFLRDNIYGIMTTNVISQFLYTFFSLFLQHLGSCLESAFCNTVFGSMCMYVLRILFNRQNKDAALVNDIEACRDRHDRQNIKLDRANQRVDEPDESSQEQTNTLDPASQTVDEPGESSPEQKNTSLRHRNQLASLPCHHQKITARDEGSSSEPLAKEKGIVPEEHEERVIMVLYIKKVELLNDVKGLLNKNFGEAIVSHTFPGSRILYTSLSVRLDEDLLRKARIIVEEGAKIDEDFTLQIENWGIYYCDQHDFAEKRAKLFKLQDSENQVQVPTILAAEYAIGILRIYGLHLEGAEIRAATSSKSKKLVTVTHEKIAGGRIEMLSCKDLLPDTNLRNLYVYATRPTPIGEGGRIINVMSSSVKIDDIHLKKALRDWLPATFTVIFVARQLWLSTKLLWNAASAFHSEVYWILPMLVITICTFLLPSRTEEWITEKLGSLCFAYLRLRGYLGSLGCSGPDMPENQEMQENQALTAKTDNLKSIETLNNPPRRRKRVRNTIRDLLLDVNSDSDTKSEDDEVQSDTEPKADTFEVKGETILVTPLEWEWDSLDLLMGKHRRLVEKKRARVIPEPSDGLRDEVVPFRVIYDLFSGAPWPEQLYVHIKSSALLGVVEKLLPNAKQVRILDQSHLVGIRGRTLFLALDKLKDELHQYTGGETGVRVDYKLQQRQLFHLVRFLDIEYAETFSRYDRMDRQACVSWDMLWTFLRPGEEVVYKSSVTEEEVCGIVQKASYKESSQGWQLHVRLTVYDYNCKTFKSYATHRSIHQFEGEVVFNALEVYPLRFPGKPEASEKHFFNQGTTFGYLSTKAKCRYMHYTGIMFRYVEIGNCLRLMRESANGRVMVDLASFFKMNPDYKLESAEPPCDVIRDNKVVEIDISQDPNRKFAPCIVYGFSFRLKKWGAFSVCGFDEIKYNVQAWDQLVMDSDLKEMTDVLVGEHLRKGIIPDNLQQSGLDTISDKGDSCIVLCYGPPGTGKTLTAEALADKHKAPLWAMSVSELGTTPNKLESQLVNVFDVAHSWHALLLLDEADIYLERRSDGLDLVRNAMTGVFLRQLEYYKGVLFLTTNRVSTFDDAFRSRITLFLSYKVLDVDQRKQIWRNFFTRVKIAADEKIDEIVDKVSVYELNGRQIRNVIQNAEKFASRQGSTARFGTLVMKTAEIMDKSSGGVA